MFLEIPLRIHSNIHPIILANIPRIPPKDPTKISPVILLKISYFADFLSKRIPDIPPGIPLQIRPGIAQSIYLRFLQDFWEGSYI